MAPARILPFEKAVSDEEHDISAFHRELGGNSAFHFRQYSKRQNLRMHVSQRFVWGRVNEKGTMTGGEKLNLVASFPEHRRDKGRKAFGRQVFRKRLVDISKDRGQIIVFIKAGTRIGAAHRCEYCRANAVSGYIGQEHRPPAVGQSLPIVKIPASI